MSDDGRDICKKCGQWADDCTCDITVEVQPEIDVLDRALSDRVE